MTLTAATSRTGRNPKSRLASGHSKHHTKRQNICDKSPGLPGETLSILHQGRYTTETSFSVEKTLRTHQFFVIILSYFLFKHWESFNISKFSERCQGFGSGEAKVMTYLNASKDPHIYFQRGTPAPWPTSLLTAHIRNISENRDFFKNVHLFQRISNNFSANMVILNCELCKMSYNMVSVSIMFLLGGNFTPHSCFKPTLSNYRWPMQQVRCKCDRWSSV